MGLVFRQTERHSVKGILLTVSKAGYHNPFTSGICFDKAHAEATEARFKAWASQGWPYEPKDEIPCYMVKTSNLIRN